MKFDRKSCHERAAKVCYSLEKMLEMDKFEEIECVFTTYGCKCTDHGDVTVSSERLMRGVVVLEDAEV